MKISNQSFVDRPPKRPFFLSGPRGGGSLGNSQFIHPLDVLSVGRRFRDGVSNALVTFRECELDGLGGVQKFEVQRRGCTVSSGMSRPNTIQSSTKKTAVGFGRSVRCANRGLGWGHGHYGIIQGRLGTTELNGWDSEG